MPLVEKMLPAISAGREASSERNGKGRGWPKKKKKTKDEKGLEKNS